MPANYLRAIPLSIIIWLNHQSSFLWSGTMPKRLYYDRIITMTKWKINHLDGPLKELKKIRKQVRIQLKCLKKPNLKSCQNFRLSAHQESILNKFILSHPIPKKWIHWSAPTKIDNYLREITNSEIENYLNRKSNFLNNFDPAVVRMHVLSEKLARFLKREYSKNVYNHIKEIQWWYFFILFLFVLLNLSLCNDRYFSADTQNER